MMTRTKILTQTVVFLLYIFNMILEIEQKTPVLGKQ